MNNLSPDLMSAIDSGDISEFLDAWLHLELLSEEDSKILNKYYASYKYHFGLYARHHYKNQTKELLEILGKLNNPEILEIGCGCGTESLWVSLHDYSVKAIDVSDKLLKVAAARKNILETILNRKLDCKFEKKSVVDLNEGQYDLIWMEQTYHHLEPRKVITEKICSLLRPGGYIIISESNAWNPFLQAMLFKLRGTKVIINYHNVIWGNERILTSGKLVKNFQKYGVYKNKVRYFRFFPNKSWADNLTQHTGMFDDVDCWLLRPFYTHYNFVGCKKSLA